MINLIFFNIYIVIIHRFSIFKILYFKKFVLSIIISNPTRIGINFYWNLGSILGVCWSFQVLSGILLCLTYFPFFDQVFECVISIGGNYYWGWYIRFFHANIARLFLGVMYLHIRKALILNSYSHKITWLFGRIILILTIGRAFLGYALPISNMSLWGVNVITRFLSVIPLFGPAILEWVWRGFIVRGGTLTLFFTLHWALPLSLSIFITAHLVALHRKGSTSSLGSTTGLDKIYFFPSFVVGDIINLILLLFFCVTFSYIPYILGDCETWIISSNVASPLHIVPEWYFLAPYAILRSSPNKAGGIILFALSVGIFFITILVKNKKNYLKYYSYTFCFIFFVVCILLTWIGINEVESPFILLGQIFTILYFLLYMFL